MSGQLFAQSSLTSLESHRQQQTEAPASTHPPGLPLRLEQREDVALTDRALDVTDERPSCQLRCSLVHELHAHLDHAAA
eukprot:CAMPEP_0175269610 /NCGR_PEP_ID=MMETSP0093-20121207/44950_1 /TAXON_ID=311494 /ORGANISM="Alexandrium monilatum, Strain CCMP3105" /LENGTH=78 /DNA_ID=CAMNT_0016564277 /DNA_START=80 /DNA_END=313 /DNA_ORIENTATION=+